MRHRRYEGVEEQQGDSKEGDTFSAEGWNVLIGWIEVQIHKDTQWFCLGHR